MIRFLPIAWEHLRINLTHNDNIKTFNDVTQHVELEEDRLLANKPSGHAYMIESNNSELSAQDRRTRKGKVSSQGREETRPT